ncbi:hypothetical protein [Aestuariirhabdus sp. LZHN29]|uniref:hypothetical protein n=1 Tax=Aestuariirhabdus sp. LZHN29 TaxID=3417462 RepID=UPI003CF1D759
MPQQSDRHASGESHILSPLKQVGKISLLTGLFAVMGIALLLGWVLYSLPRGYEELGVELMETQRHLPWLMSLTALLLIVGAAATTWVISLYASFRIAGPLYRFARNLEIQYRHSGEPVLSIRQGDALQAESDALMATIEVLQRYREGVARDINRLNGQLEVSEGAPADIKPLAADLRQQIDPLRV